MSEHPGPSTTRAAEVPPLSGLVAVVTGAGRGAGRAMARALVSAGAGVVATASRDLEELDDLSGELGDDLLLPMLSDVSHPQACERVVAATLGRFGRLDMLVNNAWLGARFLSDPGEDAPRFWEIDADSWTRMLDVNLNGAFLMARAAVPAMLAAGRGRLVNMSIPREAMRSACGSPHGPLRAGLDAMTASWARDLSGSGVTVNSLVHADASTQADHALLLAPLLWLAGRESDDVTGRRVLAARWPQGIDAHPTRDATRPPDDVLEDA